MEFQQAKEFILSRLRTELPDNLFYHGYHHTQDVCNAVDYLAQSEKIEGEPLLLLKTASLFHDAGFIKQYTNNEPLAVLFAESSLPAFSYTTSQIKTVTDIILSTQVPQRPSNLLEEIMCDADLDYLGRPDFFKISKSLMEEWLVYGIVETEHDYLTKQFQFLKEHRYFTTTAKTLREPVKQQHIKTLMLNLDTEVN